MYKGHEADTPAELESQFILRLPNEPAKVLRDAIQNSSTFKDRITVKIENDMRHGEVRIDHWLLSAKVVDLPTIVESLKTIDGKGFYKTADICQMVVCKEDDDQTTDEESPQKTKKKDPYKVEKKYLWPHGVTPPTKNVRRRRFRKTLKKKYVEAPEIEKEVKRLLRNDNDAVGVKWEIINEDDENKPNKGTVTIKKEPVETSRNVGEHDIFGSAVSDSEEDAPLNVMELDENSQNSMEDSHLTDSNSVETKILTEFSSEMFGNYQPSGSYSTQNLSRASVEARLEELELDLAELRVRRQQQEMEINNIENIALRQRFQVILDEMLQEQMEKEHKKYELQELLK